MPGRLPRRSYGLPWRQAPCTTTKFDDGAVESVTLGYQPDMSWSMTTSSVAPALACATPVECVAVHDEAWFRALYAADFRVVLGYALRRVTSPEDAADIVSETFLVAWRRRDDVPDDVSEARAWLFGTARRVLANHRRGEERRGRLAERLRQELAGLVTPVDLNEDAITVRRALGTLSDDDRELLTLTSWEELTPTEISVALGVPAATVRTRLHRARKRLAVVLADLWRPGMERSGPAGHVLDEAERKGAEHDA